MLIWMRNSAFAGAIKFILMGLLLLAVAGLVFRDAGGFFRGKMSSNTLVTGGGLNVSLQNFDRTLRRALSQRGIGTQEAYKLGLVDNVLTSEIQNQLFTIRVHDLGLEISDDVVTRQISKLAEPLATDGRSKRDALSQILRQQNISEGEFIQSIRIEMGNVLLRGAIQAPSNLPSSLMAKSLYRYDNEKRDADVVVFKNTDVSDVVKPTDEQIQKFYDANKIDFLIPESRTITVATLIPSMISKKFAVDDKQVKEEYEKNISSYTAPVKRVVEQGVFDSQELAKAALTDLKSGKPSKKLDTQELEEKGLLPEISTPLFAAQKGDIIGPIKTDLGWHILKLTDILPESITSFDKVKDKLKKDMEQAASADGFYQVGTEIEDRAAGGDKLSDIVNEYGMTTEIIGPFRRNGNSIDGKDLLKSYDKDKAKIIEAAFGYDMGETSSLVETSDGHLNLIRIDQVIPDSYRDLKDVKESLVKRWTGEQRRLSTRAKLKSAMDDATAGKPLADIAKKYGAELRKFSGINRLSAPVAPLTPVIAAQIFTTDIGKTFSSEIDGGVVIGTPTAMTLPSGDAKISEKELEQLNELTAKSLPQDVMVEFIKGLSNNKKIKINRPALENSYGAKESPAQ